MNVYRPIGEHVRKAKSIFMGVLIKASFRPVVARHSRCLENLIASHWRSIYGLIELVYWFKANAILPCSELIEVICTASRPQWSRGLRHVLSSTSRIWGPGLESLSGDGYKFALSYLSRALRRWADPPSKESYQISINNIPKPWKQEVLNYIRLFLPHRKICTAESRMMILRIQTLYVLNTYYHKGEYSVRSSTLKMSHHVPPKGRQASTGYNATHTDARRQYSERILGFSENSIFLYHSLCF
jgi:hypothetical protein